MYEIRNLQSRDYQRYLKLIDSHVSRDDFNLFINKVLNEQHLILVIIHESGDIIGTGTLLIENKLTHNGCRMGHIENVLIDKQYRSQGLGEKLVRKLINIAKDRSCYRIDLNCNSELKNFYKLNGFKKNQISSA